MSYISSDGLFSEVYIDCLLTAFLILVNMLYCRVTALDKNSQMIACIIWTKVPKFSFKGHANNKRVRRRSMARSSKIPGNRGTTPGSEVIKLFSCSTQLSMKFFLLINVKMPTIVGILTFMSRKNSILSLSEPEKC